MEDSAARGRQRAVHKGKKTKVKDEGQDKEAELFHQIRWLKMELELLKKASASSCARELRNLDGPEHPELNLSRQCVLLGLPRCSQCYQRTPVREST